MTTLEPPAPPTSSRSTETLAEVWGDVVDLRHLAAAVAVGAAVSLGCYAAASRAFVATLGPVEVARSYAMLVGLLGCVAGGVLSARLFPPKRVMTEFAGAASDDAAPPDPAALVPIGIPGEERASGLQDASGAS